MAVAWFFAPYKRAPGPEVMRYCVMDDFTAQINADGGRWREAECLGEQAIVKVRASVATLQTIAATAGIDRFPLSLLDDQVGTLTAPQRTWLRNKLVALGYTLAEVDARFPLGWDGPYTVKDVLKFASSRRWKPRYKADTDEIVVDGNTYPGLPAPERVDAAPSLVDQLNASVV